MVAFVQVLSDIALMTYLRYVPPAVSPQILKPKLNGVVHDLVILHSHNIDQLFARNVNGELFKPRPEHSHPQAHIVLYTGGGTTGKYCGQKFTTQRGLLLLISPNVPHLFDPASDPGELKAFEISFFFMANKHPSLEPFHVWLSALSGLDIPPLKAPVLLDENQTCHLISLHKKLMTRWEQRGPLVWFAMHTIMLDVFSFLLEDVYRVATLKHQNTLEHRMMLTRDCINCRYNESLKLKELANIAHLSAAYFCRRFKSMFGVTPIAYLHKRRVVAAETLLLATNTTIKEIAGQLGYGNIYSFSKAFRRAAGMAPSAYRKQMPAFKQRHFLPQTALK
ncbi:MAG: AraC family transcriptional regulator [Kiritimatiellia bacterium]|nr:AraC family transcriptional regulator [Kiritimatiellia bacterium]